MQVDTVAMAAQGQRLVTLARDIERLRKSLSGCWIHQRDLQQRLAHVTGVIDIQSAMLLVMECEAARLMHAPLAPAALSDENYPCRACGKRIDLGDVCDACWAAEQQLAAEVDAAAAGAAVESAPACSPSPEALAELREAAEHDHALDMAALDDAETADLEPGEPDRLARNCPVCSAEYADSYSTCPDCRRQAELADPVDLDDQGTRQTIQVSSEALAASIVCYRLCKDCGVALPAERTDFLCEFCREARNQKRLATLAAQRRKRELAQTEWGQREIGNSKRGTTAEAVRLAAQPMQYATLVEQLVQKGYGERTGILDNLRHAVSRGLLIRDGANVVAAAAAEVAK